MRLKHIFWIGAALLMTAMAFALTYCAPPNQPTPVTPIQIVNDNTNNNGGNQPSPAACTTPDSVTANVPTTIAVGARVSIFLSASQAGQAVQNPCGQVAWIVGSPGFVSDPGHSSTTLSASSAGSFDVFGCFGSVCASGVHVTAN